jgi:hypothetical protein
LTTWRQWLEEGKPPNARGPFYDTLDERLQDRVDTLIRVQEEQPSVPEEQWKDKVLDAISRLRLQNLRRQNRELRFLLQDDAQVSADRELQRSYVQANVTLTNRIRRLEQAISERSLSGRRQREDAAIRVPITAE